MSSMQSNWLIWSQKTKIRERGHAVLRKIRTTNFICRRETSNIGEESDSGQCPWWALAKEPNGAASTGEAGTRQSMGGLELVASLRGHTGVVWSVAWSPRGLLASCGTDRTVRVWHTSSDPSQNAVWTCIASYGDDGTFRRAVRDVAWASDGRSIAVGGFDSFAFVLELMGGKKPRLEAAVSLEGHESEVKGVSYSSSGGLLASCSRDKSVWIWEVGLDFDYDCVAVLNGHVADVKMVVWHPSVEMLVSCSYDGTVKVWVEDADDWFCSETLAAHDGTVWAAAFDEEGRGLVTVSGDGSLVVWRREDPPNNIVGAHPCFKVVARTQNLHDGPIYTVDWSHRNGLIATGGGDDTIRILRRTDLDFARLKSGHDIDAIPVQAPEVTKDETVKSVLSEACEVVAAESRAHVGDVNHVAWHPVEDNVLASCGDDGLIQIWVYSPRGNATYRS